MNVITGNDLLQSLRDYVYTFPCMCDEHEYQCLTCRAEEMIAILDPPKSEKRSQVVRLTLYGRLGTVYQCLLPSPADFRYELDPAAQVTVVTMEWVS